MKQIHLLALTLWLVLTVRQMAAADLSTNTLTDGEKAAGWRLLFDGQSFTGWHNFKKEGVRPGWQVKDGALVCADPHNAGDLVTTDKFDWFELQLDYRATCERDAKDQSEIAADAIHVAGQTFPA